MQHNSLKNKTALITGGSKRLGRAIALSLADHGIHTIIQYNNSAREADETVKLLKGKGVLTAKIHHDFSKANGVDYMIHKALKITGTLDFLINSASIYPEDTLETLSWSELTQTITINGYVPFILSRKFKELCNAGSIINILDSRMTDFEPNHISYQLSRQMLFSLTRMMSLEFAPDIRVNAVAPGIILPEKNSTKETLERLKSGNPLNRIGTMEEVSSAILFLLKNEFITGQVIYVDGGRNLRGNVYGY